MKICHVVSYLDPRIGGPFSVVAGLAAAQVALDHEVWIMAKPGLGRYDHATLKTAGLDKVNVFYVNTSLRAPIALFRQTRSMERIIGGCDIVHLHGVWRVVLWMTATIARKTGTLYAVTPHGMLDPWSLSQKRWKKRLALWLGLRTMLRRAAFLHLLNRDEETNIQPLSLDCARVIIPNGISPDDIAQLPPSRTFYKAHPKLNSRPFILFLGRLHHKKGLDYLLDAFLLVAKTHANLDLVIAGPDGGELGNIRKQIEQLQLTDRVHLVGPLYGPDKFAAYMDATVFCLPSRQEGFSMSIIEAMACQVPVIISPHCHFNEIAQVGAGEIVELEAKAISGAICRLIDNKDLRKRFGEAGRSLVLNRYTWPMIVTKTIAAYTHALANHRSGIGKTSGQSFLSRRDGDMG